MIAMKDRLRYILNMLFGGIIGALITMFVGGSFSWENFGLAVLIVSAVPLLLLLLQVLLYLIRKSK